MGDSSSVLMPTPFEGQCGKKTFPIGSMYGIYANIWGILMGSMLPYIAAPWILWVCAIDRILHL